jgi:Holliday junction resolvasome RuvABC endonuclease subunit
MRFLRFRSWLDKLYSSYPVDVLYYEEVRRHIGVDAAHAYGGFMAHLQAWAESNQVPYAGVPVGTIKKYATGKGNANKEAVMVAMVGKGHKPVDDNEADALALLYYSLTLS